MVYVPVYIIYTFMRERSKCDVAANGWANVTVALFSNGTDEQQRDEWSFIHFGQISFYSGVFCVFCIFSCLDRLRR